VVERIGGDIVSWDVTPFTRDLPLTAYVGPTAPEPTSAG
jgi:hypothetical protein